MSRRSKLVCSIFLALVLIGVAADVIAHAKENRFQGGFSKGAWEDPNNWSRKVTPESGDQVVIPQGATVTITQSTKKEISSLSNVGGTITAAKGVDIDIAATKEIDNHRNSSIKGSETGKVTLVTGDGTKLGTITNKLGAVIEGRTVSLTTGKLTNHGTIKGMAASEGHDSGNVRIRAVDVYNYGTMRGGDCDSKNTKTPGADSKGGDVELYISNKLFVGKGAWIRGGNTDSHTKKGGAIKGDVKKPGLLQGRPGAPARVVGGKDKDGNMTPEQLKIPGWIAVAVPTAGRAVVNLPAAPVIDPGTIDGEITISDILDEGVQVCVTDLVGPGLSYPITIFTKQDGEFLYMGIEINDLPFGSWEEFLNAGAREVYVASDVNQDGWQFTGGDNIVIFDLYEETIMDGFYPPYDGFAPDTDFGGTYDVVGAAYLFLPFGADNATLSVEFLVPLDSGDRIGADPALAPGDKIDTKIGLVYDTFELETQEHLILGILL